MDIACVGGRRADFYAAISIKLCDLSQEVEVFQRERQGDPFGGGVVSDARAVPARFNPQRRLRLAWLVESQSSKDVAVPICGEVEW